MKTLIRVGFSAVTGVLLALDAGGQTQRSGNDAARVMQQLQQITAEKAQVQAENDKLQKELEDLKAQLAKTSGALAVSEQRVKKVEATSGKDSAAVLESNEALTKARAQLQELIGKFRETTQTLKDVEVDRDQVRTQLAGKDRELKTCVDRNAGLYMLNDEILQYLENRGMWSALKDKEPFTKVSRARLENLIEEYRYRVDELRVADKTSTAVAK